MGRLDGKVALVGGSLGNLKKDKFSDNIGSVIAKKMQEEGAQVIVVDIDYEVAKACAANIGGNAKAMECDLLKERKAVDPAAKDIEWEDNPALDLVKSIVNDFGKIDILVCGFDDFGKEKKLTKMDDKMYEKMYKYNVVPNFHLLAAVREQFKMQKSTDGTFAKVVMLTSMVGKAGMSMGTLYSGFKGGIVGMNKGLAREFGRFANVNTVAIGPVKNRKTYGPPDKIKGKFLAVKSDMSNQPITFEKVAPLVCFLASDDAIAINGQSISVDGGLWLKLEQ